MYLPRCETEKRNGGEMLNNDYYSLFVFLLPYKLITQLINYIPSITFRVHYFILTTGSSFLRDKYIHLPTLSDNLVELEILQFKDNNWEIVP
jgi:hypothetical protein